jgi:hypothetical protein
VAGKPKIAEVLRRVGEGTVPMVEVLEQGGTGRSQRPHLPGWIGRVAFAAVLAGTAFVALPSLRGDPTPAGTPEQQQPARLPTAAPGPVGPRVPSHRPGEPGLGTSALILLRTPGALVVDVDSGSRTPLPNTVDWSGSGDTLLLGHTVVTASGRGSVAGSNRQVLALRPDGATVRLGYGSRVLAATPDSVWLIRRGDDRRTVTQVGLDGEVRLPPRPLPRGVDVSGVAAGGRLVVGSRWPSEPGPLMLWDTATGRVTRTFSRAAILHSSDDQHIVWSACSPDCPLVVTRLADGSTRPLGMLPAGSAVAGRLRLSPDGQHYAVLVSRSDAAGLDLVVGHLPGSPRAGSVSMPLRGLGTPPGQRPRLSFARSGWLFVSTGDRVYAVGPGPHGAMALDTLPRHERMVAS